MSLRVASPKSWRGFNLILSSFLSLHRPFHTEARHGDSSRMCFFSKCSSTFLLEYLKYSFSSIFSALCFPYPLRWYYSLLVSVGVSKSFPLKKEIIKPTNSLIMGYFKLMISSLSYLGLDSPKAFPMDCAIMVLVINPSSQCILLV